MNETFKVKTLFNCDHIDDYKETYSHDGMWVQTAFGCRLLLMLREMYGFSMTYIIPNTQALTEDERAEAIFPQLNDSIDIYAKPIGFTGKLLDRSCPIEAIFTWRYGFILKRPYTSVLHRFYSLPFTRPVWNCLYLMLLVVSVIFFCLSRWEKKVLGGYSCYHYELLLAVGACCQHILPLQANIASRRMAYLSFILCAYVLHCFYTSNLLSHLVSDKDNSMNLEMLANSDYECVKMGIFNVPIEQTMCTINHNTNMSVMQNKLSRAKDVSMVDGLNAVMTSKTALLSDYFVVYPVLAKLYEADEVCQLIQIDMYSNIKKYFYTSRNFTYIEKFKVGILRAKETGILKRVLLDDILPPLNCAHTYPMSAEFEQIFIPLCILVACYGVASTVMLAERWHHRRNFAWPYVN